MLAGGDDPGYRALLQGPHTPICRVEVWRDNERIDDFGTAGLPVYSGSISATLNSQVTRQLALTTDESLWPMDAAGLLAPYGNELRVFQGVSNGAGVPYEWQTFRGRINNVTLQSDATLSIEAIDRAGDVNDAGFPLPENSNVGVTVTQEFRRLIQEGVSDATFGTFDAFSVVVPMLTWEYDRAGACDELADAAGAVWYALANGDFVFRFVPWTQALSPVLSWSDGVGGEVAEANVTITRENVFNVVTVVGERADGTTPVYAYLTDDDPTSPTYAAGPFGVRSKLINIQAANTQPQAEAIARTALRFSLALTQAWEVSTTADASLELGDAILISARGLPEVVQVISSFTLPLIANVTMSVSLRALQPGLVA